MKSFKYILFLIVLLGIVVNGCQKPERDNYWDELASYDPDDWAPKNLKLSVTDEQSVLLAWEQEELVEGFKVERQAEGETWQEIAVVAGQDKQYDDINANLPAIYQYRVYAFAGKNTSSHVEGGIGLPIITTSEISNITAVTAASGGSILYDGGYTITTRGVVWSSYQNPTIDNNIGITNDGLETESFISNLFGLTPNTSYYVRAYATNDAGNQYGNQKSFSTIEAWEVYNAVTGRIWMDKNLGASRTATSSTDDQAFGDLYQWGRFVDGHEKRTSAVTSILSNSDIPDHSSFIVHGSSPYDWRSPQNSNLWQGINGINNPCPEGYRLPTEAEWEEERKSWISNDALGAINSQLKLPVAGYRSYSGGLIYDVGLNGYYWSSTVEGTLSRYISFNNNHASSDGYFRASGRSIRCIKD